MNAAVEMFVRDLAAASFVRAQQAGLRTLGRQHVVTAAFEVGADPPPPSRRGPNPEVNHFPSIPSCADTQPRLHRRRTL